MSTLNPWNITHLDLSLFIGLAFATQDARIILIKPSIFIVAAGIFVLVTAFTRPILLDGM